MSEEKQLNLFNADINRNSMLTNPRTPIPPGSYKTMEEIAKDCNQCQRCDLGKNRTNAVIGRGNPQAKIMIIGEGPGQQEDERGLPFVGRSGQLLDKVLESVELNSDRDVYISNAIRCRPPHNRTPLVKEIEACKPYLLEQIRLVNPQIILLTGAVAVRTLTGDRRGISKIRGQWMEWEGRLCMPIFHPAYLLRNSSKEPGQPKWLMWQDIQTVKAKLDELNGSLSN